MSNTLNNNSINTVNLDSKFINIKLNEIKAQLDSKFSCVNDGINYFNTVVK